MVHHVDKCNNCPFFKVFLCFYLHLIFYLYGISPVFFIQVKATYLLTKQYLYFYYHLNHMGPKMTSWITSFIQLFSNENTFLFSPPISTNFTYIKSKIRYSQIIDFAFYLYSSLYPFLAILFQPTAILSPFTYDILPVLFSI